MRTISYLISLMFAAILLGSCSNDYVPKPRGYFRIDLPEHRYRVFDTLYPYRFEYPEYARIVHDSSSLAEPFWINLVFPPFKAQVHISYKVIDGNLEKYLNDAHSLVNKHIPKANAITQRQYVDTVNHVYGLVYDIRGTDAASAYQFYLTDSISRFLRGALYFNLVPNNDSLSPVIDHLKVDIEHMINTFRWKQNR